MFILFDCKDCLIVVIIPIKRTIITISQLQQSFNYPVTKSRKLKKLRTQANLYWEYIPPFHFY